MSMVLNDLRYAIRQLLLRRGFTLVAVLTLALGMGATTTMFSVMQATVLAPLPFPDPERLVHIEETTPDGMSFSASEPNFLDFQSHGRSFEHIVALKDTSFNLTGAGDPVRLEGVSVSDGYFRLLGANPVLGRAFLPEENHPGARRRVVVLSHALWQQRFAGDPQLLGQSITLDGQAYRVVGIMPAQFRWFEVNFWLPLEADPGSDRGDHWLTLIGKLAPDASLQQARAELSNIAADIGSRHPKIAGWGVRIEPLEHWLVGDDYRHSVVLLFAAVALLLGIACVNLANLLFVRTHASQAEIGLRTALGASRWRILRQWLSEVLVLSSISVALGLALTSLAIASIKTLGPASIPRLQDIQINTPVLLFALLAGLGTAALFGIAPAWRASRVDSAAVLQHGGRTGMPPAQRRLHDLMVVAQVALSALLLVGAGILIRGVLAMQNSDPGFNPQQVMQVSLQLGEQNYAEPWQKVVFFDRLTEGLVQLPGVDAAGAIAINPFSGTNMVNDITPVERAVETGASGYMQARWRAATPGFFRAAGLPLMQGRLFSREDRWDGPRNVVISALTAERLWPDQSAIGKALYWGGTDGTPLNVIGVVANYQDVALGEESAPVIFLPYNQLPWPQMTLMVRAEGDAGAQAAAIRGFIHSLDPLLPVPPIQSLQSRLNESVAGPRIRAALLLAFGLIALLLAAIGIYGIMAFNFGCRKRELGLRLVVGAHPGKLLRMLLASAARLVLLGSALGAIGAWAGGRLLNSVMLQTAHADPLPFICSLLLLGAVAMAAVYFPARRVLRLPPMDALRRD